jgi:FtsH-binding integral membrane protein
MPGSLLVLASTSQSSSSASTTAVDIVISLAVLVFILYRQRQVRRASPTLVLPVVLIIIGLLGLTTLSRGSDKLTSAELGILIALLALDAVGLGVVRAMTVRLWRDGDSVLRQGTWLTVGLWLVGIVIHEVVDLVAHIPSTSLLLYLGVTLLAQQLVLQARVNRVAQQPGTPAGQPGSGAAA